MTNLISESGGIRYHLRALRHARSGWSSYRDAVGRFLASWKPEETNLILVGPSGGYALNAKFLGRFDHLTAIDPDPLARTIFRTRFRDNFQYRTNTLSWIKKAATLESLKSVLQTNPKSAVLFCNLLGQLPLLAKNPTEQEALDLLFRELPTLLSGRSYASFHDRLSGPLSFSPAITRETLWLSNAEIRDRFYPKQAGLVELTDHETESLFPGLKRFYMEWKLTPRQFHLIEGVHS